MTTRLQTADHINRDIASLFAMYRHYGEVITDTENRWAAGALDDGLRATLQGIRDDAAKARAICARRLDILGFQV